MKIFFHFFKRREQAGGVKDATVGYDRPNLEGERHAENVACLPHAPNLPASTRPLALVRRENQQTIIIHMNDVEKDHGRLLRRAFLVGVIV
jgi:hypothetical protein